MKQQVLQIGQVGDCQVLVFSIRSMTQPNTESLFQESVISRKEFVERSVHHY